MSTSSKMELACKEGYHEVVRKILSSRPESINFSYKYRYTPLHIACLNGQKEVVSVLLAHKAKVNAQDKYQRTPLEVACWNGNKEVVLVLLAHNAYVNAQNNNQWTPLHTACDRGHKEVVLELLAHNANVNTQNNDQQTPLHIACKKDNKEVVSMLLAYNANVNTQNNNQWTPLHTACDGGNKEVVSMLLAHNANVNTQNNDQQTPLHTACEKDNQEVVSMLLAYNTNVNTQNNDQQTPLHIACEKDNKEVVSMLLAHNANVNTQNKNQWTPLHTACDGGNKEVVLELLTHNANVNTQNNYHWTPLHRACRSGHKEVVSVLLDHNADVEAQNYDQETPLHVACLNDHKEVVSVLLAHNANLRAQAKDQYTPLHLASWKGHKEIVSVLLAHNANTEVQNKYQWTPLHVACKNDHKEVVSVLLAHNADVEAHTWGGETPLHIAWRLRRQEIIELIVEHIVVQWHDEKKLFDFLRDVAKMFDGVIFSKPKVKIPPSRLITNKVVDGFPWESMSMTLTHLDLSDCGLTELPKGFCYLNEHEVVEINLEGNPFSNVVVDAVVRERNAKDIILMAKELKGGGVELKQKKVLVVGDAAVGKTTLLRALRGEGDVAAKVATDGIEIGELELDGVVLNCWDFAGQEVYRYTHQLFMSGNSIYVVLFNLSHSLPSICSQLTYWLDSISHRAGDSELLLVGTHASVVPREKMEQMLEQVAHKFGRYVNRNGVVVDSLSGEGLNIMKKALSEVARHNLPRVPRLFEKIRQFFHQYGESGKEHSRFFVEMNQLKQDVGIESLTDESWRWCLRVMNYVGSIVLVDRDSYAGNKRLRSTFVIVRPSWLVDMFKTVVTMRHNYVKDGIISMEGLRKCWEGYDLSMHDLLLEALEKFDVVCRLSGRGGDNKVIVPCLLADCAPDDFFGWTQNGETALCCLLGRVRGVVGGEVIGDSSTFRRSFVLKCEKREERSGMPVGVMGKVLCSMFQWGKVRYAWKTGCVVVCGDHHTTIVGMMWEGDCGGRPGVHFVFCEQHNTSPGSQCSPSSSSSCSSSLSSRSSSSSSCSLPSSSPSLLRSSNKCASMRGLLQQASQLMKNLFEDFYRVEYEVVVPCCVDEQGVPVTWVNVDDIIVSLYQLNDPEVSVVTKDRAVVGKVAVGGLAPDLMLDDDCARFFDEDEIVLGRLLGNGAFGEVFEGEVLWDYRIEESLKEEHNDDERNGGKGNGKEQELDDEVEKVGHPQTKKVAVKKILLDKLLKEGGKKEEILKELHHETYLSLKVRHPNVVEMVGMCAQTSPPLLLLELLDGDLYSSLMDPLGLESILEKFSKILGLIVVENKSWDEVILRCCGSSVECCDLLEQLRERLARTPTNVQQNGERLIARAIEYVNDPTRSNFHSFDESVCHILEAYKIGFEEIAPLSLTGVLRIAADISQGLHYLHSQMPSLIHRDLKGPNIFITRRFINGGGTEQYASQNIVAKLGDFGLSAVLCGPYQLRAQGNMEHINQRWAAPEILEGRGYSVKSDVYSMGLTFWETRYRMIAYHDIGGFEDQLKVEIGRGARPKLRFHDEFDEIIEKCWCSSPSKRLIAQQAYSSIRSLCASVAPSLYAHLPPISTTTSPPPNNPNSSWHEGTFVKKVELPHNIYGERSHRVTCLTTCDGDVWGGCPSGFVFCFSDAGEEQQGEQGERGGQKGELVLCHQTQLCGEGRGMAGVNAMVGDKGGLVWAGTDNGWLSVWKSVDGRIAGEEVKFRVPLLHQSWKKSMFSAFTNSNQNSFLKLEFGVVSWEGLSSFFAKQGQSSLEEDGMAFLKDIKEVREMEGKLGGLGVVLVDKEGKKREFEFENREEEGRKALDLLKFGLFCVGEKKVLKRVGEHDLKRRVIALEMAGGRVWSFDDSFKICEWKATHDQTGKQKRTYRLAPLRCLDFTTLDLSFDLSQNPFSCFFPVGNEELYVIFKQFGVILERSSSIVEQEREGGTLEFKRVWDLFGEEEEGRECKGFIKDDNEEERPSQSKEVRVGGGGGRQREDVWCGVYFGLRKEVWWGTSEGWVWRKGNTLEKKKVEGGVRVMAVVGSQIWCGTTNGEVYRFDAINFVQLHQMHQEIEKNQKKYPITSFGVVHGGMRVWSGSLDRTISLWC